MVDEDPYQLPTIDESKWFVGGHLGSQIQSCNWQVGRQRRFQGCCFFMVDCKPPPRVSECTALRLGQPGATLSACCSAIAL